VKISSIIDIIDGKLLNSPSISFIYSFKTDVAKVKEGDLFIAYNLDDIQIAIQKGAFAIILQNIYPITDKEIAWIKVENLNTSIIKLIRYKLAHFNLNAFYSNDISCEFLKTLSSISNKNIKILPKNLKNFISTLNDDNIIFLDKSKNDCSRDGIYAFTTVHGLFVKRIQKRVDGHLDIISDNKDYPSQVLNNSDIKIVGKVISTFGTIY